MAHRLALENDAIRGDMVEAIEFPQLAVKYGVMGVPKVVINEEVEFEGATILYINPEGKIIDRWGAFCFYDIFADLGLLPQFWELHKFFPDFKK